jgi:hypothetical protein
MALKLPLPPAELTRRRRLLALIGAGLSLPAVLREAGAQPLIPAAQGLRQSKGVVRVDGVLATPGTSIRPGSTVTTGPNAYAMFVVGRDAYLIRENSRAELGGKDLFVDALRLVTGKLLGVFGSSSQRRELATGSATIGIRGTGGYLEAYPQRQLSYFCLCYGAADIGATKGGAREVYVSRYHEAPRYIHGDGRAQSITTAPVINHSDSELIMLEALVDRKPPQSFIDNVGSY